MLVSVVARCGPQLRSPIGGNFAMRRIGARIRLGVDHRSDDALGAEIERPAHGREFADRNPHDRRRAAQAHLGDRGEQRGGVPKSVLAVERDRWKAFAADELGDDRIGQAAPAGVDGFTGAQPAGKGEGG